MAATHERGWVYIVWEREFIRLNEEVYKVGHTVAGIEKRVKQYPEGSILCFTRWVSQPVVAETSILAAFKKVFKHRKDIGSEYFEGDLDAMVQLANNLCNAFPSGKTQHTNIDENIPMTPVDTNNVSSTAEQVVDPELQFYLENTVFEDEHIKAWQHEQGVYDHDMNEMRRRMSLGTFDMRYYEELTTYFKEGCANRAKEEAKKIAFKKWLEDQPSTEAAMRFPGLPRTIKRRLLGMIGSERFDEWLITRFDDSDARCHGQTIAREFLHKDDAVTLSDLTPRTFEARFANDIQKYEADHRVRLIADAILDQTTIAAGIHLCSHFARHLQRSCAFVNAKTNLRFFQKAVIQAIHLFQDIPDKPFVTFAEEHKRREKRINKSCEDYKKRPNHYKFVTAQQSMSGHWYCDRCNFSGLAISLYKHAIEAHGATDASKVHGHTFLSPDVDLSQMYLDSCARVIQAAWRRRRH